MQPNEENIKLICKGCGRTVFYVHCGWCGYVSQWFRDKRNADKEEAEERRQGQPRKIKSNDTVYTWLLSRCEKSKDGWELIIDLYMDCIQYHVMRGINTYPVDVNRFGVFMHKQEIIPIDDYHPGTTPTRKRAFKGIKLKALT